MQSSENILDARFSRKMQWTYQIRAIRAGRGRLFTWQAMEDKNLRVLKEWYAEISALIINVLNFVESFLVVDAKENSFSF